MAYSRPAQAARCRSAALRIISLGGLVLTLGGCMNAPKPIAIYPNDYHERFPITLKDGERTVEVFLGRARGGLSPAQRADVMAFAAAWKHNATSGIIIDVPRAGTAKLAAADSLREIHSILNASGVPGNGVRVRSYVPADLALPSIKMSYAQLTATAGPCGRWPFDLGPSDDPVYQQNRSYWNHGCASQRNLAAMVDNPADLVQPRGESAVYTGRRTVMMDKYRKGENPSAAYPNDASNSYDAGKISSIGK
jgi:pilus assembly protein CpaD